MGVLNDAAKALAARQATDAEAAKQRPSHYELTREERATYREAMRAANLLHEGLARLKEGKKPTLLQMPFVQRYLAQRDDQVAEYKEIAKTAQINSDYDRELYFRIATEWNRVCDVLRELGVECFENHAGHGFRGSIDGKEIEHEGYASEHEALKAALQWRIGVEKEGKLQRKH